MEHGASWGFIVESAGIDAHEGAKLVIVDSVYKIMSYAKSETIRSKVYDDFMMKYGERGFRDDDPSIIVAGSRFHEDDLIGRLTTLDEPWEHINVQAIAGDDDILGRSEGEALWGYRHTIEELLEVRKMCGSSFEALYQGVPRVE